MTRRPLTGEFKEVELDAGKMTIRSVRLPSGRPLRYRYEGNEKLCVQLDQAYPAGRDLSVTIAYTAKPDKGMRFVTPSDTEPDCPYQIWTDGQPERNHYWFPCYD